MGIVMALVIFDLDETLVNHRKDTYYELVNIVLSKLGEKKISPEEYANIVGIWGVKNKQESYDIITKNLGIDPKSFFSGLDFYEPHLTELMIKEGSIVVFDDVLEAVKTIRGNGHKIAVVTSSRRDSVKKKIGLIGDGLFDLVVTGSDVEKLKPNPEPLLKAVDAMGFQKEDVVFVGDSEIDRMAAGAAGIRFIMINRDGGIGNIDSLQKLHGMIDDENKD
jgi:beta-phosphoglucomutase-like phosphatase (HAD superfamily)